MILDIVLICIMDNLNANAIHRSNYPITPPVANYISSLTTHETGVGLNANLATSVANYSCIQLIPTSHQF
jgi:hypothetical protein